MKSLSNKNVSLVLGSGGARGLAHIGVIKALEEKGAIIDEVVGCSIGALIGGLYAYGKLDIFEEWICKKSRMDFIKLMDFSMSSSGILKGDKIIETLKEIIPDVNIETLPLCFSAISTDLTHEEEIVFRTGSMYDAIRASIAIPGIFTAKNYENKVMVDGAVLNPLPLNCVLHSDNVTVAVNLNAFPKSELSPNTHNGVTEKHSVVSNLRQAYDASQRKLSILALELHKPDYVIQIPENIAGIWEYEKAEFLIEQGRKLAMDEFK